MKTIKLNNPIINDEYTSYIYESFDIQDRNETEVIINHNIEDIYNFDWNIGVIVGGSGSGKTTILNDIGKVNEPLFHNNKPLISNFNWLSPKNATFLLSAMGLSSVPTWLRPYNVLSNGEKYRAQLAYQVGISNGNDIILIDEYTSVVDRDVAKAMSFALQKYIRRTNKKIILASCHYDILEWLTPDWICSPHKNGVIERGEYLRQSRPKIELQISRVESDTWDLFKKHHYLTENINKSCKCFIFSWNDKVVGFCGVLNTPRKGTPHAMAISRVVVLPEFQGLGLGKTICNFIGGVFTNDNKLMYIKTVNPALGLSFEKSEDWIPTSYNGKLRKETEYESGKYNNRVKRVSYCYKYNGNSIEGYEELLLPIGKLRKI